MAKKKTTTPGTSHRLDPGGTLACMWRLSVSVHHFYCGKCNFHFKVFLVELRKPSTVKIRLTPPVPTVLHNHPTSLRFCKSHCIAFSLWAFCEHVPRKKKTIWIAESPILEHVQFPLFHIIPGNSTNLSVESNCLEGELRSRTLHARNGRDWEPQRPQVLGQNV